MITVAKGEDAVPKPAEAKPVGDAEVQPNAIVGYAPSYGYRRSAGYHHCNLRLS